MWESERAAIASKTKRQVFIERNYLKCLAYVITLTGQASFKIKTFFQKKINCSLLLVFVEEKTFMAYDFSGYYLLSIRGQTK